jgi:hypothetical protein
MFLVARYKATPGAAAQAPPHWPDGVTRPADKPALVLFAHPRCPCTRASLTELGRMLTRLPATTAYVIFVRPSGAPADWERTESWTFANSIPGVQVFRDDGGVMARRFGASVSGQTFLYDAQGRLLFSGGLTVARGHEGRSLGQERIAALLSGGKVDRADAPVFGCALLEEARR